MYKCKKNADTLFYKAIRGDSMRKTERYICIFCVVFGFAAAYVIGYRYGNYYENDNIRLRDEIESDRPYMSDDFLGNNGNDTNDASKDVSAKKDVLRQDAIMILETCNESDEKNIIINELDIPIELIGYTRDKVIEYLEKNGDYFVGDNEELINIMLVSFAEDRVVIRKNVREGAVVIYPNGESERYNYYVGFKDEKVVVFKKDKETVFIETGITFDMLERETRESISEGVWIENINMLYRYLESITS